MASDGVVSTAWITAFALLATGVGVMGVIVLGVIRRCLPILERAEALLHSDVTLGLPPGVAPGTRINFDSSAGPAGSPPLADLRGRRSVVLFVAPQCPPCEALAMELREAKELDLGARLVAVVPATPDGQRFGASLPIDVVYQRDGEISALFETKATPHAFAVDEEGVVREVSAPNTAAQLVQLTASAWGGGERAGFVDARGRPAVTA